MDRLPNLASARAGVALRQAVGQFAHSDQYFDGRPTNQPCDETRYQWQDGVVKNWMGGNLINVSIYRATTGGRMERTHDWRLANSARPRQPLVP